MKAGATWAQIAAAVGASEAQVRQGYREWADAQHRLWAYCDGRFGMDADGHAISRAAEPEREAG